MSEQEMRDDASAVLTTLEETVPDDLAYVRAQLSEDYDSLFRDEPPGRSPEVPAR